MLKKLKQNQLKENLLQKKEQAKKNNFAQKVLNLTEKIPRGKVTTYKIIAEKLNCQAYRAVGTALKNNAHPIIIPCHRVINTNLDIGSYAGIFHNPKKETILKKEGIKIKNNKIDKEYLFYF
ncbi:MGMT family protein [Candidatus Woesearchaeota archaeon]|nr:MGMT family protein [Candidatus Woesearchaeota archaeon]